MTTPINIPKLGISMTEATLLEWAVPDGAEVQAGDAIYTLETEKVENEITAPVAGVIRHIGVEGEIYPVGTPIAEIS